MAMVEKIYMPGSDNIVKSVTTNYLLTLKQKQHGEINPDPHGFTYAIIRLRNIYNGIHIFVHMRHSNFKFLLDPTTPIIMVGPDIGIAPFYGFIQEHTELAKRGNKVDKTILFFRCHKSIEDFSTKMSGIYICTFFIYMHTVRFLKNCILNR